MNYWTALTDLKTALNTDERPAVINRQEINPPCVWITLRSLEVWNLCGDSAEAALALYLVIGDRNDANALEALQPLLAELIGQLVELNLPIEAIEADQVRPTDSDTPYPAFRIETHLTT